MFTLFQILTLYHHHFIEITVILLFIRSFFTARDCESLFHICYPKNYPFSCLNQLIEQTLIGTPNEKGSTFRNTRKREKKKRHQTITAEIGDLLFLKWCASWPHIHSNQRTYLFAVNTLTVREYDAKEEKKTFHPMKKRKKKTKTEMPEILTYQVLCSWFMNKMMFKWCQIAKDGTEINSSVSLSFS